MPMGDNLRKRAGRSWSRLEALLALGTGAAAEPIAGIAGLAGLLGGLDRGARNVEATRNALTYQPRDPRGMQELGQALAPIVEPYERAKNYMGDGVLEATGSPGLATAAYTAPDALAALVGLRTGGMKGPSMQQMAERSAGPGMGQPASQVGAIGAWHGSPHDFDRFSMDKLGTGEGAAAYGHGLYFAGAKDVAGQYRKTLAADGFLRADGSVFDPSTLEHLNVRNAARSGDVDAAIARAEGLVDSANSQTLPMLERDLAVLRQLRAEGGVKPNAGRLYNVELAPDETDLLDWDAPLSASAQTVFPPNKVREVITAWERKTGEKWDFGNFYEQTGQQLYETLADAFGRAQASTILRDAGIPGIRYLDGQSRSAGEGSRNYVMFDDSLVKIRGKE